jgi:integrase
MKIKNGTLKFINGKDNKVYLRYFATIAKGQGKTYDIPCNCKLSKEDLIKLRANTYGGIIQKACNKIKSDIDQVIIRFIAANNDSYPTPEQLRLFNTAIFSKFNIEYHTNQYFKYLTTHKVKGSSKATYGHTLKKFKEYFIYNLYSYTVAEMISKTVVQEFGKWLLESRKFNDKIKAKDLSNISVYNSQVILFKYLNNVAGVFNLPKIEDFLQRPSEGQKYHLTDDDVQRILAYEPKTFAQEEILNIIRINKLVGLRIGEILTIDKRNVEINGVCRINFIEHKKGRPRTIVIVKPEAIQIIKDHLTHNYNALNNDLLFHFNDRSGFNRILTTICKSVFKTETVMIYKQTAYVSDFKEYPKYKVISSHAFRRYAIERNISEYGIETARTLSGHRDYATIIKHYSDFLNASDLEKKLLKQ